MSAMRRKTPLPFEELITLHQRAIYGYLLRFTRDTHDAQDLFQETFLRAYRAYAKLEGEVDHRAWLMRIAINLSKNYIRDRQRRGRVVQLGMEQDSRDEADTRTIDRSQADVEGTVIANETQQNVLLAIEALPFRQRTALVQRQFEGLDYQTIASNLACSQDTARAHVYQALRKLRQTLANHHQTVTTGQEE